MSRYRLLILILLMAVVFAAIAAPLLVTFSNQKTANETQLAVTCTSARANIDQLTALNEIADRLGIPHEFMIPNLPEECL